MPPTLADYIEHILAAIGRICTYTQDIDHESFTTDGLIQDAVIRNLEIIGEASQRITHRFPDFAASHPELTLGPAHQMREIITHGDFEVDLDLVWQTIVTDLPKLTRTLRILSLGSEPS
jgi:uncharacterized protein with HEPN domain